MKNRFVIPWVTVVLVIIVLQVFGDSLALMTHPSLGYDKLLHFLGGSACGIFGVALISFGESHDVFYSVDPLRDRKVHNMRIWISVVVWAIVIGGGWEILQAYVPAMRDASDYDWYDTVGDLIFDITGGIVAGFIYREKG